MNILFVTFNSLVLGGENIRSVFFLRALADAGHQIDVIATEVDSDQHPNVHPLMGQGSKPASKRAMRLAMLRAMGRKPYDAVHAVDEAVLYIVRLGRLRKARIVYEASRCFSGPGSMAPAWHWRLFPKHYERLERRTLQRTDLVFSSCEELSAGLGKRMDPKRIFPVEDVPAQSIFPRKDCDQEALLSGFEVKASLVMVFRVLDGNQISELRTLMLAARKVVENHPTAVFFFKGVDAQEAQALAANLDLQGHCAFLDSSEPDRYLAALSIADAALFVPSAGTKCPHPEILTLLNSPALVVAVRHPAYASVLNDANCVRVNYTASSISDGLLRVVREPLLAYGIVYDARKMIVDRFSFSSFKHRVRMAYYQLVHTH